MSVVDELAGDGTVEAVEDAGALLILGPFGEGLRRCFLDFPAAIGMLLSLKVGVDGVDLGGEDVFVLTI